MNIPRAFDGIIKILKPLAEYSQVIDKINVI
jgi:hypothetical protein